MIEPPEGIELLKFPNHVFWFDENGIFCGKSISGKQVDLSEMKEISEKIIAHLHGKKVCMLIDFSNVSQANRETRDFVNSEFPKIAKAAALLSQNPLGRMMANLFFNLKKQPYPTKMFDKEEDAKRWLLDF
ncbi:MAG: STAS/SEC14 domain-containing protein [Bacteroidota bacterium]